MHRIAIGCSAILLVVLTHAPVSAQTPDWCTLEGRRVRVHTTSDFTPQGISLGCSGQSLLIRPDGGPGALSSFPDRAIPFFEVESVDVSRGIRRPVMRSVVIGGAVGGALFSGFAYLTGNDGQACSTGFCVRLSQKRKAVAGFVVGAVLGAGGGLLHGLSTKSDIWRTWPDVPLGPEGTLTLLPGVEASGAVRVGLTFSF